MTIAHFNEEFFEFARKHNIPVTTYSSPKRYGIIPCRRCAFWSPLRDGASIGKCLANSPDRFQKHQAYDMEASNGAWPTTWNTYGCGDGLLREEAAPLPPEQEPKP